MESNSFWRGDTEKKYAETYWPCWKFGSSGKNSVAQLKGLNWGMGLGWVGSRLWYD